MNRLIIGCGYVGERVASRWIEQGDQVFATVRTEHKASKLKDLGIIPILWDWRKELPPTSLDGSLFSLAELRLKTVLIAVSHAVTDRRLTDSALASSEGSVDLKNWHDVGLEKLHAWFEGDFKKTQVQAELGPGQCPELPSVTGETKWIYLSTTGVMGNNSIINASGGTPGSDAADWLDESAEVNPTRDGAKNAAAGEAWIAKHESEIDAITLRPVGIYGPERVPNWKSIRDQVPIDVSPDTFLNLVHVDDLVKVITYFADHTSRHSLYLVGDNHPVRRGDYYGYIADICRFPKPIYQAIAGSEKPAVNVPVVGKSEQNGIAEGTSPTKSRRSTNKKISAQRLHDELPFTFTYPTYREGLKDLLAECIENDRQ